MKVYASKTPRSKHSNLRGLKKTRSGCDSCKKRKKKCDETKPICKNCTRLNLSCSYDIKLNWNTENQHTLNPKDIGDLKTIISGLKHLASENWKPKQTYFINFSKWDLNLSYRFQPKNSNVVVIEKISWDKLEKLARTEEEYRCESLDLNLLEPLLEYELQLIQLDPTINSKINEEFLFSRYANKLSRTKSFSDSDSIPNDFRFIVIPGCKKFPALYHSVLSLSVLDLIKSEFQKPIENQDKNMIHIYYSLFIRYKNDALNFLHDILDDFDIEEVGMLEELVVTIIVLCNVEITNKGNKDWVRYLKEASIIFSTLSHNQILDLTILTFAYRYFSLRYILLSSTLRSEELTDFMTNSPWPIIDSFFDNDEVDPMFGCSPRLLQVIYKLTLMNHLYELNRIDKELLIQRYLEIWSTLNRLTQIHVEDSKELHICSGCYLLAAKIFLCSLLLREELKIYVEQSFFQTYKMLLPNLWNRLAELSLWKKSLFFPNWCLLIISNGDANGTSDEINRIKVLQILDALERNWPLSSVVQIRKAIESIWKIGDLKAERSNNQNLRVTNFDWRSILNEYGYMLSLT